MQITLLITITLLFVAGCAAGEIASTDVNLNTQAILARQTSEAASAKSGALSAQATAARQATLDTQGRMATDVAVTLTFLKVTEEAQKRYLEESKVQKTEVAKFESERATAQASATAQAKGEAKLAADGTATWEAVRTSTRRAEAIETATFAALQTATRRIEINETSTATAAVPTQTLIAAQAQAASTRAAIALATAERQAEADAFWAPLRAFLWTLIPLALLCIILAAFLIAAYLGVRRYMLWEQTQRLVEKGENGLVVILSNNRWGGKPEYKYLQQPGAPALLTAGAVDVNDDPYSDVGADGYGEDLPSLPLNLDHLPHALALPCGVTHAGERYLSLNGLNHVLVAGPSGSGKTMLLQAFILALCHRAVPGRQVELALYDGKQGMKFGRHKQAGVTIISDAGLPRALATIHNEMSRRYDLLTAEGCDSFVAYNLRDHGALPHVVMIIDELKYALEHPRVEEQLVSLMRLGREAGIHIMAATQFIEARYIPLDIRGNADTRIAFAVPSVHNSISILGSAGAEQLPKLAGRYLLESGNERIEAQAFTVNLSPGAGAIPAPVSAFTEDEKKMIVLAASEGGWFKVRSIAAEMGIDDSQVTEIAKAWESRGWLSVEKTNLGRPGKNGRAMLAPLLERAGREGIIKANLKSPLDDMGTPVSDMGRTGAKGRKSARIPA